MLVLSKIEEKCACQCLLNAFPPAFWLYESTCFFRTENDSILVATVFIFLINYANFHSGILIDTFSTFHTRLLPAVGVPVLVSYIRGVSPTLLPSLQHVCFPV